MQNYIGIDVGGSSIKGGIVRGGEIVFQSKIKTPINAEPEFFRAVFGLIDDLLKQSNLKTADIAGIGMGVPGLVVADKGLLLCAPNVGLENVDVVGIMGKRYPAVKCKIANDVSCFALAEFAKSGIENLVYLAIGTGINAGVINRGKLYSGAHGMSIEFGHIHFGDCKEKCACGGSGCLEQFVSGKALRRNDGMADEKFLCDLGKVLISVVNAYRPEVIFIGGGCVETIEPHIDRIRKDFSAHGCGYKNAPSVRVEISKNAYIGGILGASLLVQ